MTKIIKRSEFLNDGFFVDRCTSPQLFHELIKSLRPVKTKFDLIRIGPDGDGGYLVPNDLKDISIAYSPGVSTNAEFELDLFNKFRIESHLADYSVNSAPEYLKPLTFTKKFVGSYNDEVFMTMQQWMNQHTNDNELDDLLLSIDIEGAEYNTLLSLPDNLLKRFRIIIMEIHNIYTWGQPHYFQIVQQFFKKLTNYYHVVHLHPNNHLGTFEYFGVECPYVLEISLLRKDRADSLCFADTFPHTLDQPCTPFRPDFKLPPFWHAVK